MSVPLPSSFTYHRIDADGVRINCAVGGIRHQLEIACAAAGFTPRISFEANTPLALADLAERGLGVAILPRSISHNRAGLHPLSIVPELRGRLVLAWRAAGPMSPAARAVLGNARHLFE
jgi:DNA-binding transcriptional LysR family regulator